MIRVSGKFTLQALIPITTWPSFGSIGATSSSTSFSAGPNSLQINAFIVFAFLRYRIKIERDFSYPRFSLTSSIVLDIQSAQSTQQATRFVLHMHQQKLRSGMQ